MADAVNLSFVMSERTHLAVLFLGLCIQLPLSSLSGVVQSLHGPDPGGHQLACSHGGCIPEMAHHRAATHQTMARTCREKIEIIVCSTCTANAMQSTLVVNSSAAREVMLTSGQTFLQVRAHEGL